MSGNGASREPRGVPAAETAGGLALVALFFLRGGLETVSGWLASPEHRRLPSSPR